MLGVGGMGDAIGGGEAEVNKVGGWWLEAPNKEWQPRRKSPNISPMYVLWVCVLYLCMFLESLGLG